MSNSKKDDDEMQTGHLNVKHGEKLNAILLKNDKIPLLHLSV